jgi:hypothetical protein
MSNNRAEYRQFTGIARGSAGELKYHLLLAKDLGYIETKDYERMIGEINSISKMLYYLIQSLTPRPYTPDNPKEAKQHILADIQTRDKDL